MKTIGLFLVLVLCGVVTGCDTSHDPIQHRAATNICGGPDKTIRIWMEGGTYPSYVNKVKCSDGAVYRVRIESGSDKPEIFM